MATKSEQTETPKNLRVLHTQLDGWQKGAIVSPDDLPHPAHSSANDQDRQRARDAQVQRLVSIGAVEEVTDAPAGEELEGPHKTAREQGETRYGDGNHPLSFFDGKDDESILGYAGIGKAKLKEIRDAQAERDKAK